MDYIWITYTYIWNICGLYGLLWIIYDLYGIYMVIYGSIWLYMDCIWFIWIIYGLYGLYMDDIDGFVIDTILYIYTIWVNFITTSTYDRNP